MTEIKYKAWDKRRRRWVTEYVELRPDGSVSLPDLTGNDGIRQPEDVVIVFYTGLKDKNGVEEYHGDLVRCRGKVFEIKWDDTCAMFYLAAADGESFGFPLDGIEEAIGNIYENPELVAG